MRTSSSLQPNRPVRLIGLTGRMRSGKDTAYELLRELTVVGNRFPEGGAPVERLAFADKLKQSVMATFGLPYAFRDEFKERGKVTVSFGENEPAVTLTGREFLQRYGTEGHREVFGSDFWTTQALAGLPDDRITVVTDVRFDDEAIAVRAKGGEVWEISRPGPARTVRDPLAPLTGEHKSEQGVSRDLVDRVIVNDGTMDEFGAKLAVALGQACQS